MTAAATTSQSSDSDGKAYRSWNIHARLFDGENREINTFDAVQEIYVVSGEFIIRVHRDMDGAKVQYEDRGSVNANGLIEGRTGFGGQLTGQLLKNNEVFFQGRGGEADFIVGALPVTDEINRCMRRHEVHSATTIFGIKVEPGIYFSTSEDHQTKTGDQKPPEFNTPLSK